MNHMHRFARWVILLYARIAAAVRAWDAEGERLKRDEDGFDEAQIRGRMMQGAPTNSYCNVCKTWNGHQQGCVWWLKHQSLVREDRTPATEPQKEE